MKWLSALPILLLSTFLCVGTASAENAPPPRRSSSPPVEWLDVGVGQSYIYNPDLDGGTAATIDAIDGAGLTLSLGNLVDITALADTAACDLEIFVASA